MENQYLTIGLTPLATRHTDALPAVVRLPPRIQAVMRKKIRNTVFSILVVLAGCASIHNPKEMVYVGTLSYGCENIRNERSLITIPITFKVKPLEAAKVLKENSRYGCKIKMGFSVYADNDYYYLVNNNQLAFKSKDYETIKKYSFIVNPSTGELVSKPEYEKDKNN